MHLWDELALAEPVRLLGVTLSELREREKPTEQLDLFAGPVRKSEKLGLTMDAIASKFGRGALRYGADAPEKVTLSDREKVGDLAPAPEARASSRRPAKPR